MDQFKGTLPYSSELFGIYQPLLGWKSKITAERYDQGVAKMYDALGSKYLKAAAAPVQVTLGDVRGLEGRGGFEVEGLEPLRLPDEPRPRVAAAIQSGVAQLVSEEVGNRLPVDWENELTYDRVNERLERLQRILQSPEELERHPAVEAYVQSFVAELGSERDPERALTALFDKEARIAGYLVFLAQHSPSALNQLFFPQQLDALSAVTRVDPLLSFGDNNYRAILSPIGIIHLYREYFFEFDSFLGPPVGHVWLSPGGTVELVEVNTRKVLTERTLETSSRRRSEPETQITTQDDIADAVKEENRTTSSSASATPRRTAPVFEAPRRPASRLDSAKTRLARDDAQAHAAAERKALERDQAQLQDDVQDLDRDHRHVEQALRHREHHRRARQLRAAPQDAQSRRAGAGHRRRSSAGTRSSTIRARRSASRSSSTSPSRRSWPTSSQPDAARRCRSAQART